MKFTERQTQFPGRKLLTIVNDSNQPVEGKVPIFVNIESAEGDANPEATPVSAVNLNKGNWRDDKDLSFRSLEEGESLPIPLPRTTQIYTTTNGDTWIVPPAESTGVPKPITDPAGSLITINEIKSDINFSSNPQDQIDACMEKINEKVGKTGNEDISGSKKFLGSITMEGSPNTIFFNRKDKSLLPQDITEGNWFGHIRMRDMNNRTLSVFESRADPTQNYTQVALYRYNSEGTSTLHTAGLMNQDADGIFAYCPTPGATHNRNSVATTEWVRARIGEQVDGKANLVNGTMSDPVQLKAISSLSDLVNLGSAVQKGVIYFTTTNGGLGNPFSEFSSGYSVIGSAHYNRSDEIVVNIEMIDVAVKHACCVYSGTKWHPWTRPKGWKTVWNGNIGLDAGATLLEAVQLEDVYRIHAWMPNTAKPVLTTGIVQIFPGHGGNAALIYNFGMMRSETMESYSAQLEMTIGSKAVYNRSWPVGSTGASNLVTIHRIDKEIYV